MVYISRSLPSLQDGLTSTTLLRWCRCAQPLANGCDPCRGRFPWDRLPACRDWSLVTLAHQVRRGSGMVGLRAERLVPPYAHDACCLTKCFPRFCSLFPTIGSTWGDESIVGERAGVRGSYRSSWPPHLHPLPRNMHKTKATLITGEREPEPCGYTCRLTLASVPDPVRSAGRWPRSLRPRGQRLPWERRRRVRSLPPRRRTR